MIGVIKELTVQPTVGSQECDDQETQHQVGAPGANDANRKPGSEELHNVQKPRAA